MSYLRQSVNRPYMASGAHFFYYFRQYLHVKFPVLFESSLENISILEKTILNPSNAKKLVFEQKFIISKLFHYKCIQQKCIFFELFGCSATFSPPCILFLFSPSLCSVAVPFYPNFRLLERLNKFSSLFGVPLKGNQKLSAE